MPMYVCPCTSMCVCVQTFDRWEAVLSVSTVKQCAEGETSPVLTVCFS